MNYMLTISCCLYKFDIPVELREIIKKFLYAAITNNNISFVVDIFIIHKDFEKKGKFSIQNPNIKYGDIKFWDTSNCKQVETYEDLLNEK